MKIIQSVSMRAASSLGRLLALGLGVGLVDDEAGQQRVHGQRVDHHEEHAPRSSRTR